MSESVQIAAFTGGELHVVTAGSTSRDVALALPFSRLLVKLVRIPADSELTVEQYCAGELKPLSPFPDGELTVSCETVREGADGKVVFAVAMPEDAADDIAEALDAAKLNVMRIDALPFGMLRALWSQLGEGVMDVSKRQLLLVKTEDDLSLFVLDGDQPVAVRSLGHDCELVREMTLSLLEAEDFGGGKELASIFVAGFAQDEALDELAQFAPVVRLEGVSLAQSLEGIAARTAEEGSVNALPASWREVLDESHIKAKLKRGLAIAGGIWAFFMLLLFGVPIVYGLLTGHQKSLIAEHRSRFNAVNEVKEKVELARKYSDHEGGALELLRIVSENLPVDNDDMVLTSFDFKRGESMKISGEASDQAMILAFKNNLARCGAFTSVGSAKIDSMRAKKGGGEATAKFSIECSFVSEEEAQ